MEKKTQPNERHQHNHQGHEFGHVHQVQEREHHDHERHDFGREHVSEAEHKEHQARPEPQPQKEHQNQIHEHAAEHGITIFIDHLPYKVANEKVTGAQVRALANPPIDDGKDLFHAVAGKGADVKMGDDDSVEVNSREVTHGRHFYSAAKSSKAHAQSPKQRLSREEVEKKAYFNWLNHGSQHGHDVEYWLDAEG